MIKLLQQILDETQLLSKPIHSSDHERYLQLVELRESLTSKLVSDIVLSQEEKLLVREILKYDSVIMHRMQRLKDEAEEGINRIHSFKRQKSGYEANYGGAEGIMFDRRN
ncbi:hypothetical protein [Paenibacillus albus]|uniref:Flagellar protein FliT n=1 Tax=Paenibacillus albus TaxID=2495582 RepID=A0A3S8ZYF4_9BACL|nr:hypothetical protein [Paenibacillus albus]AZN38519.1 hypothetical protein EJC50_01660 [Paenibacillus albus]